MKQITQEWLDKGEGDFATALRELRARKSPNYDACFYDETGRKGTDTPAGRSRLG